ncbi:MAG TPA: SIMPL domain-containing protein [Actinophytocola sp.]|jgi:uncharacterized protein YggE|nr:SIMPL domain-containing protein [Actinophytocola sp.]
MGVVERPWGVAVQGTAMVRVVPDLARVRFRVGRAEKTLALSFAAAARAAGAVRETLRGHGVRDEDVASSRLGLESRRSGYSAQVTGFQCEVSFAVESRDLDGVQQLLVDLVAAGVTDVDALEFDVADRDEPRALARRRAVEDARRAAELYADAAGVRLGAVLHIEDVAAERFGEVSAAEAYAVGSVAVVPGRVVVPAAVVLGFAIV